MKIVICCFVWVGLVLMGGCVHAQNERLELGTLERTASFDRDHAERSLDADAPRSRWDTTVFVVPIDGISHGAAMRVYPFPRKSDEPRVYGLMPSVESSLAAQGQSGVGSMIETLDEIGASGIGLLNPLLMQYQLTNNQWSPKRSRQEMVWASGPIANSNETKREGNDDE
jgi:hypothetical protein